MKHLIEMVRAYREKSKELNRQISHFQAEAKANDIAADAIYSSLSQSEKDECDGKVAPPVPVIGKSSE